LGENKAQKVARTIVADFFLYNKDKIDTALKEDNFFESLKKELEDSEAFFKEHIDSEENEVIFWDALFNRLMQREAKLLKE